MLLQAVERLYSASKELFKIPEVCFSENSDSITLDWEVPEGWSIHPAYVPARVGTHTTYPSEIQ